MHRLAIIGVAAAVLGVEMPSASASEDSFLDRFKGGWTGSGSVRRNIDRSPWNVQCSATGEPGPNRISIQGTCRAAVIVQRQIGAELTYDPRSGLYQGVYTGARVGPAQLSGRRSGDAVNLRIRWPRPVNGDTQARLTITNTGTGALRISVADNLTPDGPVEQTSDLVLQRR